MKKMLNHRSLTVILVLVLLGATFGYARSNQELFGASPTAAPAAVNHQPKPTPATGVANGNDITKNETIYVKLAPSGQVKDTTVVSWLHFSGAVPARVVDPVQVQQVKALNGAFKLKNTSQGVEISGLEKNQENIYYSGHSNKALPVKVAIDYYLNGERVSPNQIAGRSGQVKMVFKLDNQLARHTSIRYTSAAGSPAAEAKTIYTPLAAMVSLELPADHFSEVKTEEGMITVVGETMKVNYILFPYPSASASLTMKAEDFRLEGINIAIQPQMPPLPDLSSAGKLNDLNKGLTELDKNIAQLETGASDLVSGQSKIQAGLKALQGGVDQLITLNQAEEKIAQGAWMVNNLMTAGVKPLAEAPDASDQVKSLYAGLQKQNELLTTMLKGGKLEGHDLPPMSTTATGLGQAKAGLDKLVQGSQDSQAGAERLHNGAIKIRQQGVAKLQNGVASSLNEVRIGQGQVKLMEQAVKNYNCFLGKPAGSHSGVQFVYQTEAIK